MLEVKEMKLSSLDRSSMRLVSFRFERVEWKPGEIAAMLKRSLELLKPELLNDGAGHERA